ncbi:uncharacterized protein PG986_009416 [Apiospora aurea]|uniref:Uncharacterized protein n=1 Tax=Apiospora aurea TaxID=335848 RepID=A0ABR1Q7M7_9PEZI
MMNLLRLQAELVDLEQQLEDAWSLDRTASTESEANNHDVDDRRLYGIDFWHMHHRQPRPRLQPPYRIAGRIRGRCRAVIDAADAGSSGGSSGGSDGGS